MFWNKYPYTDVHELNLDWVIAQIMELHHDYDEFKAVNTITNGGYWDITKQYQAWTIVSDNNAGYISLKPVPAGVALSNTEYWRNILDYEDLRNRVETLEDNQGDLSDLTTSVTTSLVDAINSVNVKVYKKAAIFGNSFASGVNGVQGVYYGIKDLFDDTVYYNRSGAGFLGYTNHANDTFIDAITGASSDNAVTDVIVLGAVGDVRSQQEYSTYDWANAMRLAIQSFVSVAHSRYPNAKRIIYINCSACPSLHAATSYSASGYTDFQAEFWLHNLMPRCVEGSDMVYGGWAGWEIMLNPSYFQVDNVHPTQAGTNIIVTSALAILNGAGITYPSKVFTDNGVTIHLGSSSTCLVDVTHIVTPTQTKQSIKGASNPSAENVGGQNVALFDDNVLSFYPPIGRYGNSGGVFAGAFNTVTYAQFLNNTSYCREQFNATTLHRNINQFRSYFTGATINTYRADRFPETIIFDNNPLNSSNAM